MDCYRLIYFDFFFLFLFLGRDRKSEFSNKSKEQMSRNFTNKGKKSNFLESFASYNSFPEDFEWSVHVKLFTRQNERTIRFFRNYLHYCLNDYNSVTKLCVTSYRYLLSANFLPIDVFNINLLWTVSKIWLTVLVVILFLER